MTRLLLRSTAFLRAAKKIVKRNAQLAPGFPSNYWPTMPLILAFKLTIFQENWRAPGRAVLVTIFELSFLS